MAGGDCGAGKSRISDLKRVAGDVWLWKIQNPGPRRRIGAFDLVEIFSKVQSLHNIGLRSGLNFEQYVFGWIRAVPGLASVKCFREVRAVLREGCGE